MQKCWEDRHRNNEQLYLTGSHLKDVLQSLNIKAVKIGGNTLVIGVGLGYEVQELREFTPFVDVLDISYFALERVKDITRNQYLASELIKMPADYYDLVISHLVTQHMSDMALSSQLIWVIKALKKTGIFAMQLALLPGDKRKWHEIQNIESQKTGYVFRSLLEMQDMVNSSSGYISATFPEKSFDHTDIKHQFIHIKRL